MKKSLANARNQLDFLLDCIEYNPVFVHDDFVVQKLHLLKSRNPDECIILNRGLYDTKYLFIDLLLCRLFACLSGLDKESVKYIQCTYFDQKNANIFDMLKIMFLSNALALPLPRYRLFTFQKRLKVLEHIEKKIFHEEELVQSCPKINTKQREALLKNPLLSFRRLGFAMVVSLSLVFFSMITLDSNIMRVNVEKSPKEYIVLSEEFFTAQADVQNALRANLFNASISSLVPATQKTAIAASSSQESLSGSISGSSTTTASAQISLYFHNIFSFFSSIIDTHLGELITFVVAGIGLVITGIFEIIRVSLFNGGKLFLLFLKNIFIVWPLQLIQTLFLKYFHFRYNRRVFLDEKSYFLTGILFFATLFQRAGLAEYLNRQIVLLQQNMEEFEKAKQEADEEKEEIIAQTRQHLEETSSQLAQ